MTKTRSNLITKSLGEDGEDLKLSVFWLFTCKHIHSFFIIESGKTCINHSKRNHLKYIASEMTIKSLSNIPKLLQLVAPYIFNKLLGSVGTSSSSMQCFNLCNADNELSVLRFSWWGFQLVYGGWKTIPIILSTRRWLSLLSDDLRQKLS